MPPRWDCSDKVLLLEVMRAVCIYYTSFNKKSKFYDSNDRGSNIIILLYVYE